MLATNSKGQIKWNYYSALRFLFVCVCVRKVTKIGRLAEKILLESDKRRRRTWKKNSSENFSPASRYLQLFAVDVRVSSEWFWTIGDYWLMMFVVVNHRRVARSKFCGFLVDHLTKRSSLITQCIMHISRNGRQTFHFLNTRQFVCVLCADYDYEFSARAHHLCFHFFVYYIQ